MSVAMDTSGYRLFTGGSNGTIFAVNLYGQVLYTFFIMRYCKLLIDL